VQEVALSANGARLYEIGRYYWGLRTPDGVRKSLYYFTKMVDADPVNARGYAALADANVIMGDYCYGTHMPAIYLARARAYADKALALDPNSADANASLGFLALDRDDVPSALAELRRAIALNPSNGTAHQWYGIALLRGGERSEGARELKLAQELDPLSAVAPAWLGSLAYESGRFGEAIKYSAQTLELAPGRIDALRTLGEAYEATGDVNRAIRVFQQYAAEDGFYRPDAAELLARAYTLSGNTTLARAQFAYARKHGVPHRFGSENSMRLLLGGSETALSFLRPDPDGLNVHELVNPKG
jgi:tetratricopeptide (TPR) repeat protein